MIMEQHNILERRRTQRVETESLTSVDDSQLTSHGKNSTLASGVRKLRGSRANQGNHTRCIDDTALLLAVPAQALDRVFRAVPYPLDIDIHRQVPDLLRGLLRISILGMHDPCIVEHHVQPAPGVEMCHRRLHLGLLGHVDDAVFHPAVVLRHDLVDLGNGPFEAWRRDIGHKDGGALAEHENCGFKPDTTIFVSLPLSSSPLGARKQR